MFIFRLSIDKDYVLFVHSFPCHIPSLSFTWPRESALVWIKVFCNFSSTLISACGRAPGCNIPLKRYYLALWCYERLFSLVLLLFGSVPSYFPHTLVKFSHLHAERYYRSFSFNHSQKEAVVRRWGEKKEPSLILYSSERILLGIKHCSGRHIW